MTIKIFNTLTNQEEIFIPKDPENIKMYVCGPTVYQRPHLGNARSVVFYDLLFRILKLLYKNVTFVRNITDVDDKILNQAKKEGISPFDVTKKVIAEFKEDTSILHCETPTFEPKVTDFIPQILNMIERLLNSNHAYINSGGDVMFDVSSFQEYGKLSNRNLADLQNKVREIVDTEKRNDHDFVLWKSVPLDELGWNSKFSYGRPGWHIECSAMSVELLGMEFDIHGGGADLQFPHHENEIAQSECAFKNQKFANYWIHNGFLTINGDKMSKSLGNFLTLQDLIKQGYTGEDVRFALLNTHYRKPLSFSDHLIKTSQLAVKKFNKVLIQNKEMLKDVNPALSIQDIPNLALNALFANINISKYTAIIHSIANDLKNTVDHKEKLKLVNQFYKMLLLIGIIPEDLKIN